MSTINSRRAPSFAPLFGNGLVTVPSSLTLHPATPVNPPQNWIIYQMTFCNTGGVDGTVTVQDANGKKVMAATTIAAASPVLVIGFEEGLFMNGGIYWQAAGSTFDGEIFGVQYRQV